MPAPGPSLVGRERELERLVRAAETAVQGRGSMFFVTGEAGIGKSRMLEEAALRAEALGCAVLVGACWEGGGAPAFWPIIQVLRGLVRRAGSVIEALGAVHRARLGQLLPELSSAGDLAPLSLDPERAQFELLDAITLTWQRATDAQPLCVVLEDLHMADQSTLQLLEFLAPQVRTQRLLVLGSFRPGNAWNAGPLSESGRLATEANTLPLERLQSTDVERFVRTAGGASLTAALLTGIVEQTEGHPLFMVEMARLLRHGEVDAVQVPRSVEGAITQHLARLSPDATRRLKAAAVLGREFDGPTLFALLPEGEEGMRGALVEAERAELLVPLDAQRFRFSHVLIRECLYESLDPGERRQLHLSAARLLERRGTNDPAVAHHYGESGLEWAERAAAAALSAADKAMGQYAFRDAVGLYRRALVDPGVDEVERTERRIALGRALLLSGDLLAGRTACEEAASEARALGNAELLARAALELGGVFTIAGVSGTLIDWLEEALKALPAQDSPLRAVVMARLAAARQPCINPEGPMVMAEEAIAMARRCGSAQELLLTLRAGCSALVDLAAPDRRLPLNAEHVALSRRLGDAAEELRGRLRLSFDQYELGDVARASETLKGCFALAESLGHPHYLWRAHAAIAMHAAYVGDFKREASAHAEALRLARQAGDPNAEDSLHLQACAHASLRGRHGEACSAALVAHGGLPHGDPRTVIAQIYFAAERAAAGEAVPLLPAEAIELALCMGDRTLLTCLSEVSIASGDRALSERLLRGLLPFAGNMVHGGMLAMHYGPPVSAVMARLHAALGHAEEASGRFQDALAATRLSGSKPWEAWVQYQRAGHLFVQGSEAEAVEAHQASQALAQSVGLDGLLLRLSRLSAGAGGSRAAADSSAASKVRLEPQGATYLLCHSDSEFALKATKGMRMLARLLSEPGREFHVLELVGDGAVDTGDSGEVLDEQAITSYRARLSELRRELAEAEGDNDVGRSEKLRVEVEALQDQLVSALGLGGRKRRAGGAAERARVNVQRRLKDALARIEEQAPNLARRLQRDLRTGLFCCYEPV